MKISDFPDNESVKLNKIGSWPEAVHYCSHEHFTAVVAAWHVGRPLLVRGEAGIGKSQLANAVAQILDWQLISVGIQPQTEYSDLLWEFDAISRLATAQLVGALAGKDKSKPEEGNDETWALPEVLQHRRFIKPGPLWWAYRPDSAKNQCDIMQEDNCPHLIPKHNNDGLVLLIDEIDKADSRLPNGLLEILGNGDFSLPEGISKDRSPRKPLVIITSNDERQLPIAFVRRCLVLDMVLPEEDGLIDYLVKIANSHAEEDSGNIKKVHVDVHKTAAKLVVKARKEISELQKPPGVAEYLDLLNALGGMHNNKAEQEKEIAKLAKLTLTKQLQMAN